MNPTAKIWLLRLAGIPITILVPMIGSNLLMYLCKWLLGDGSLFFVSIPILVVLIWSTLRMAGRTVFASRENLLSHGIRRLGYAAGFMAFLILAFWGIRIPERPYDRATLEFSETTPATVNVSGTWTGTWTDPRAGYEELISLTLDQTGNTISGTIHSEKERMPGVKKEREWDIIDGQISGDRINLYYRRGDFRMDIPATLLGLCKQGEMSGEYFGHVAARTGFSTKGTWHVTKTKP
ncbi:MAG: hypothetical protein K9N47_13165 [Prosthecobacter sp.]|uniref:hypothetical protein n=1 Tax=Prosthecobacter sp. TaxID=1965333 RepID=UPI0025DD25E5|nr:hypothetical protein [Prosthecobacter sp.]MCF7787069.1 hypothetical protein [Prosthecobacter sp.]